MASKTPTGGAISLSIAAVPFFARIAESAFSEVDPGLLEAAISTGALLLSMLALVAWLVSRQVTTPIREASLAAGRLAAGHAPSPSRPRLASRGFRCGERRHGSGRCRRNPIGIKRCD